jgi:four helix bundle protein
MTKRTFDLEDRFIDFAIAISVIVESLHKTKFGNQLGNQLIRCGTSPALNYGEAQGAESPKDFIHKLKIVLKELRESLVCLKMIKRKPLVTESNKLELIIQETNELISIMVKSIKTSQQNSLKG